ncbi:MAG: hypothetical protein HFG00_09665 [Oscillibacter sp.]|nr:hypothetical protein [Oscillibacter sp.]
MMRVYAAVALGAAVLSALLAVMVPAADPPVKVCGEALGLVEVFAFLTAVSAWAFLALSRRKRRDFLMAFGLNLLALLVLCQALDAVSTCYFYYVPG